MKTLTVVTSQNADDKFFSFIETEIEKPIQQYVPTLLDSPLCKDDIKDLLALDDFTELNAVFEHDQKVFCPALSIFACLNKIIKQNDKSTTHVFYHPNAFLHPSLHLELARCFILTARLGHKLIVYTYDFIMLDALEIYCYKYNFNDYNFVYIENTPINCNECREPLYNHLAKSCQILENLRYRDDED